MGMYKKVVGARPSVGNPFFLEGKETSGEFVVMINRIVNEKSRKEQEYTAIECAVLESDVPRLRPKAHAKAQIMAHWDGAGGMLVDFGLVAGAELLGEVISQEDIDEASWEMYISKDQPLAGRVFKLRVFQTISAKTNKPFTNYRWSWIEDEAERARVRALAASLGLNAVVPVYPTAKK